MKMTNIDKIVDCIRNCETFAKDESYSDLTVKVTDRNRDFLLSQKDKGTGTSLIVISDLDDIEPGKIIRLRLSTCKSENVFSNWNALLNNGDTLQSLNGEFFVVEDGELGYYSKDGGNKGKAVKELSRFLKILNEVSDDKSEGKLLLHTEKSNSRISIIGMQLEFENINTKSLQEINDFYNSDELKDTRSTALNRVIANWAGKQGKFTTLQYLLTNIDSILEETKAEYAILARAFSYESVKDSIEQFCIEYISKIHNVLSDISGQILAIPAAAIVVTTQIRDRETEFSFFVNISIIFGATVYYFFLKHFIRNQNSTLDYLGTEVDRQETQINELNIKKFAAKFSNLHSRIHQQKSVLNVLLKLAFVGWIYGIAFYFYIEWPTICGAIASDEVRSHCFK